MRKFFIFTVLSVLLCVSCASRKETREQKDVVDNKEKTETVDSACAVTTKTDTVTEEAQKEDEPKQAVKQRKGDFYTCDYEWDGTREWFDNQQYKDEARIKLLQEKITASVNDSLYEALKNEVKRWNAVMKAFDKMVDGQADLSFTSGGGSVSYEISNGASVDLRYYRRSCLKEDLKSLTDSCKLEKKTISTSKLFAALDKRVNALNVENVYQECLSDRHGGVAGYKKELATCKKQVRKLKKALNAWIEARRDVSATLDEKAGFDYLHHTQKLINSLTNGF